MAVLRKFTTKSGKKVLLRTPAQADLGGLVRFINSISREDTFVSFSGERITRAGERKWLRGVTTAARNGKGFQILAFCGRRAVGTAHVVRGKLRKRTMHRGEVGIMIERGYRGEGIGTALFDEIERQARRWKLRLLVLTAFADNKAGIGLYKKMGFRVCGRIPGALFRKGKYSDEIVMYKPLKGG